MIRTMDPGLIDPEALDNAFLIWEETERSSADLLVDRGHLSPSDRRALESEPDEMEGYYCPRDRRGAPGRPRDRTMRVGSVSCLDVNGFRFDTGLWSG